MASNQQDELDRLLDTALAGYSSEEPRPGLEQRVLARIQAADTPRSFGWRWVLAIPALASLLLLVPLFRVKPPVIVAEHLTPSVQPPAVSAVVPGVPPVSPAPRGVRRTATRSSPVHVAFPRRGVFPVPSPPSSEERALMDLVTRFPEQARELLTVSEQRSIEPIEIQKIDIPPLPGGNER